MTKRSLAAVTAALSLAALAACSPPPRKPKRPPKETPRVTPTPEPAAEVTHAGKLQRVPGEVQEVFDLDCITCHRPGRAKAGLRLDAEHAYASLVDRQSSQARKRLLVSPGEPGESYLLDKMRGTHLDVGGHGARMPLRGTWGPEGSLSDDEVERIRAWIADGAPAR